MSAEQFPNQSEVARLREQIALECEAANRVYFDPSIVARHDFISQRYANLDKCLDELRQHMTEEAAVQMIIDINDSVIPMKGSDEHTN